MFGVHRTALVTEAQTSTLTSGTQIFECSWVAPVKPEVCAGITRVRCASESTGFLLINEELVFVLAGCQHYLLIPPDLQLPAVR